MTEPWRIRLLGGLSLSRGESSVTRFRTQKTGELLAYLAFYGGQIHPRESLLEILWPDSDLSAARNSLSVALNSLRRQMEPPATPGTAPVGAVLIADRSTVRLHPDAYVTDVATFEAAIEAAASAELPPAEIAEHLIRADQLYKGELLPGFYDDWVVAERDRLAAAHRRVLRRLPLLLLQIQDFERAQRYAHRAVQVNPRDEASRYILLRLYGGGRPQVVPEAFQAIERLLEAAGDLTPASPSASETTGTEAVAAPAPPKTITHPQTETLSLPIPLTRFFGREPEIEDIQATLRSGIRLLTMTGPGGAGKTRLALEAVQRLHQDSLFGGGVWFVPFADIVSPDQFFDTIRGALRLQRPPAQTSPRQQVIDHLAARVSPCLLVLDNLEHLLGHGPLDRNSVVPAIKTLLTSAPSLSLLITSREALSLDQEREFPVPSLPVPLDLRLPPETLLEYPSISLFVDRAQTRRVDFQITPRNAEAIAGICVRLDGIPLAIELAAVRARLYTPSQILERLNAGFDVLADSRTDIPHRHRSLRAAIAWSFDLLSPATRRLFARLSLFRGGGTIEAAEAICGEEVVEGVSRLRDASLLLTQETNIGDGEEMRFRLLEPLREFAGEQLPAEEREPLELRHAEYFLGLAETAAQYRGAEQNAWFDRLEADHDNIRAALARFANTEMGLRLAGALARFWAIRGYLDEGAGWLERALTASYERDDPPSSAKGNALNGAGMIAYDRGDYDAARDNYQKSLEIRQAIGDRIGVAASLSNLGNIAYRRGDSAAARTLYEESLAVARAQNYPWGIASALGNLANVVQSEGDLPSARTLHEECLAIAREMGDTRMIAYTLHNLGNIAQNLREIDRAHPLYAESLDLKRSLGDRRGVAALLISLGFLALQAEDFDTTYPYFIEALQESGKLGTTLLTISGLEGMAWYAGLRGMSLPAVRLWAAAAAARDASGTPNPPEERAIYDEQIAAARAMISAQAFDAAWAEGKELSLDAAIRLATHLAPL